MLKLICNIEVRGKDSGAVSFDYVNSIEVKTSIKNLTDTAVVKVPRKMTWREKPIYNSVARDDEITIQAGYAEHGLETIFKGYVTTVENSYPVVINCENEMRLFKTINVKAKKYDKFNIKTFIESYAKGITVETVGDLSFGSMDIKEDMPLSRALDEIMKAYTYVKGFFRDGKFYVTTITTPFADSRPITFSPERNMISDSLKYILAEDVKVGVKAVSILRDNAKLEAFSPADAFEAVKTKDGKTSARIISGYEQRQFFNSKLKTQTELQDFADNMAKEFKTDKMSGSFKAFGVPFIRKGNTVLLRDRDRLERDGKKFVADAVDYSFGTGGYRQTITLGDQIK